MVKDAANLKMREESIGEFGISSSLAICRTELPFSALFAVALDRLCFSGVWSSYGAILHQGPVRKRKKKNDTVTKDNPEAADMLGVMLKDGPRTPVFLSDLKIADTDKSAMETALYAYLCSTVKNDDTQNTLGTIGLAGSTRNASVSVFWRGKTARWLQ